MKTLKEIFAHGKFENLGTAKFNSAKQPDKKIKLNPPRTPTDPMLKKKEDELLDSHPITDLGDREGDGDEFFNGTSTSGPNYPKPDAGKKEPMKKVSESRRYYREKEAPSDDDDEAYAAHHAELRKHGSREVHHEPYHYAQNSGFKSHVPGRSLHTKVVKGKVEHNWTKSNTYHELKHASRGLGEETEQIDEISSKLAQSYLDKSKAPVTIVPKQDKRSFIGALQARRHNRFVGQKRAEAKVQKEEVDMDDIIFDDLTEAHRVHVVISKGEGSRVTKSPVVRGARSATHAMQKAAYHYHQQGYKVHDTKYAGKEDD